MFPLEILSALIFGGRFMPTPAQRAQQPLNEFITGMMLDSGEGIPQDHAESTKLFRKAPDKKVFERQFKLGKAYANEVSFTRDYTKAIRWSHLEAETRSPPSSA